MTNDEHTYQLRVKETLIAMLCRPEMYASTPESLEAQVDLLLYVLTGQYYQFLKENCLNERDVRRDTAYSTYWRGFAFFYKQCMPWLDPTDMMEVVAYELSTTYLEIIQEFYPNWAPPGLPQALQ